MPLRLKDRSQVWYEDILAHHFEEARAVALKQLEATDPDPNGCLVTPTVSPRKLRFRGFQDRAYRFVYCVLNRYPASSDEVVRHQCHNRRCINPDHLLIGSKADNLRDNRDFAANGVDFRLL